MTDAGIRWEMLVDYPAESDYEERSDKKKFLPIEYYREKANQIFGPDKWGAIADSDSVRFMTVYKPDGVTPNGQICTVNVQVIVEGCQPKQAIGFAPVQFSRDSKTRKYLEEQQIDHYTLAIRSAVARGIKEALKQFGVVFEPDLKGRGKKQGRKPTAAVTKSAPAAAPAKTEAAPLATPKLEAVSAKAEETKARNGLTLVGSNPAVDATKADPWSEKKELCSEVQLERINTLLEKLAKDARYVLSSKTFKMWGYNRLEEMSKAEAKEIIEKLEGVLNSAEQKAS